MTPLFVREAKDNLPAKSDDLPYYTIMTDSSYGGYSYFDGIHFINFQNTTTYCGAKQYLFSINPDGSDYVPRIKFINTQFNNVNQSALGYFMSPPWSWADLDDCGNYPCTAPNNILLSFE